VPGWWPWQGQARALARQAITAANPEAEVETINRENFGDFIG